MGAQPKALDQPPAAVVETHVSTLFFVGDRVYKLHKPVRFGFLRAATVEDRRRDCEREVELNRRLAPDVYLGVAELTMDEQVIDHMVVMRRLPDSRRLASLACHKDGIDHWLHLVATRLAEFHRGAERSSEISADATSEAIRAHWQQVFDEAEAYVGPLLDAGDDEEIRRLSLRWIEGRGPLLRQRIAEGCICDGHGDLQAADIFCLDDGIRVLDCLEFSDQLRHGDVCADMAFLAMDLERLDCLAEAWELLRVYQTEAGMTFPPALLHHYWAYRAYIRSMVASLRSGQGDPDAPELARKLHAMALSHLREAQVRLVLVGGLPGSGKTTLTSELANATGWKLLHSDDVRRQLGESSENAERDTPPFPSGRYGASMTRSVYEELIRQAEAALALGDSVIIDASWNDSSWRLAAASAAERLSSDLMELCLSCAPDVADARIRKRLDDGTDSSEATSEVRKAMSVVMDPWPSARSVDTTDMSPQEFVRSLIGAMVVEKGPVD